MRIAGCVVAIAISTLVLTGAAAKEIAFTFDDAPRPATPLLAGADRSEALLRGLEKAGIAQAAFFAISGKVDAEGERRLRTYARAGHLIANHTATHPRLRDTSADSFLKDVASADRVFRSLPGFRAWFRFPFLDEGETVVKRDAVRAGLRAMGYGHGYVTVDNYDWYIDGLAQRAARRGAVIDREALGALYVEAISASVAFYDGLAVKHLGRSPRHVLLLHENDLAAMYVERLAAKLTADGWTIVTADAAYADPIAKEDPQTLLLGQGRVAALAIDRGAPRRDVFGPYEEEEELDALFRSRVLKGIPTP
jgi:peptidoglycan/xylan/chitin deacetylase (PgdA/CDA1 family)